MLAHQQHQQGKRMAATGRCQRGAPVLPRTAPRPAARATRIATAKAVNPFATSSASTASASPFASSTSTPASAQPQLASESAPSTSSSATSPELPYAQHKWMWRNKYVINVATAGCGEPLILIHGFGLSSSNYRKSIQELSKTYKVYALDLLGFGASSKPLLTAGYSMEVWRDLVLDFMKEFTSGTQATLVGNSIGGLTCLMVAAEASPETVRGVVLLNTAGAMNNKGIIGDWRILLAYPILLFIDFLLSIPAVAAKIFGSVRSKDNIKQALLNVYSNKAAVTDELIELVYAPSNDPNAREVFTSVITGPPGPSPFQLVPRIQCPLLVLWGEQDMMTPADGPVGKYFQKLPSLRPNTTFKFLPDVGHLLHDDRPELVHAEMLPWLQALHQRTSAMPCETTAASVSAIPAADATLTSSNATSSGDEVVVAVASSGAAAAAAAQ